MLEMQSHTMTAESLFAPQIFGSLNQRGFPVFKTEFNAVAWTHLLNRGEKVPQNEGSQFGMAWVDAGICMIQASATDTISILAQSNHFSLCRIHCKTLAA